MLTISSDQALQLVQQHWQITGEIDDLPSYADRNFKISGAQGNFVFKIANPNWSYADLDIENAALLHLARTCPDLALPKIMLAADGSHIIPLNLYDDAGNTLACHMRLLTFVSGQVYAEAAQQTNTDLASLEYSLGLAIGKLDRGLSDFQHPAMMREVDWSISQLPGLIDEITHVEDAEIRALVQRHLHYFADNESQWRQTLPQAVIHNDANDYNVIVSAVEPDGDQAQQKNSNQASAHESDQASDPVRAHYQVDAIIDFGDMCFHLRAVDLAITIVYALQHAVDIPRVKQCITAILKAYQSVHPLSEAELRILPALINARLSQSVLMATRAFRKNPANTYILVSQKGVHRLLRQFEEIGADELEQLMLSAIR